MVAKSMYDLGAQPSVIRELFVYGRQQAAIVGEDAVFDFSIGNPSIPPPPEVNATLTRLLAEQPSLTLHGYTLAAGTVACRAAIAADLNERFATGYGADDLFITCGAAPALTSVFHALCEEGEANEFIVSAPYFPEYRVFVEAAGAKFIVLPPETERFQIDIPALAAALTPHTRALIVNSPNNPSGVIYDRSTYEQLATLLWDKAAEYGHPIYIVSDEPYRELVFDGRVNEHIPHFYSDTVICYSFSKSLSLPGERIGYVLIPPQTAHSEALLKAVSGAARALGHICAPSLMQNMVAECVSVRPDISVYQQNARLLYEKMTEYGYQTARPDGAFYLFFAAPGNLSATAFSDLARDRYNMMLVPGDSFGCPGWLRLSYCVPTERIEKALPLLEKLIHEV